VNARLAYSCFSAQEARYQFWESTVDSSKLKVEDGDKAEESLRPVPFDLCGDYLDGLSSEGALRTGEEAAERLAHRGVGTLTHDGMLERISANFGQNRAKLGICSRFPPES
jgi:hypothetical protein